MAKSTDFLTSFTASESAGIGDSSSIDAGKVHLFFFISSRMSLICPSPLPNGTVSEHLTAMQRAGLLQSSRRGREVLYERTDLGHALIFPQR